MQVGEPASQSNILLFHQNGHQITLCNYVGTYFMSKLISSKRIHTVCILIPLRVGVLTNENVIITLLLPHRSFVVSLGS